MRQKVVGIYKPDNALQIEYCPHSKDHSWTIAGAFSILVSTILQPAIKHHLHANKHLEDFQNKNVLLLPTCKCPGFPVVQKSKSASTVNNTQLSGISLVQKGLVQKALCYADNRISLQGMIIWFYFQNTW